MGADDVSFERDIDGTEGLHTRDGTPITPELLERLADEAERGYDLDELIPIPLPPRRGEERDSVALPQDLRRRVTVEAERRGITVEELAIEALERHLAS